MKLIDLLVQELPKRGGWEFGGDTVFQDYDGEIRVVSNERNFTGLHLALCDCYRELGFSHVTLPEYAFVTRDQYEAALAASKQPEWDGEGLPGIGVTCEHCPGGTTQTEWEVVTVIGISKRPSGMFTDYWLRKEDGSSYVIGNPYRFRPIRTEAERKRDDVVDSIVEHYIGYHGDPKGGEAYIDRARSIYAAIAAGKIPGIKLDGDA